jgi:hypothetical protein
MWYSLAAKQGDPRGKKLRARLARKMTPAQIAEAWKLAEKWRPRKSR